MLKSSMTLMRNMFRTSEQISDYAYRHRQTLIEYKQGYLYCYPILDLSEVLENCDDTTDIIAFYNCRDFDLWRPNA